MTIILKEVKEIYELISNFKDQKLPVKLSYKIMKILSSLEPEIEFYQNHLRELIQDCAEIDDEGKLVYTEDKQNIKLKPDKSKEFSERYNELTAMEVSVIDLKFTLEELENLQLTPQELYILDQFILEPVE